MLKLLLELLILKLPLFLPLDLDLSQLFHLPHWLHLWLLLFPCRRCQFLLRFLLKLKEHLVAHPCFVLVLLGPLHRPNFLLHQIVFYLLLALCSLKIWLNLIFNCLDVVKPRQSLLLIQVHPLCHELFQLLPHLLLSLVFSVKNCVLDVFLGLLCFYYFTGPCLYLVHYLSFLGNLLFFLAHLLD